MGKTDLGKWMITNGGEYSSDATYEQLTMVKYGNSTYITLKTVTGITPADDKINYQLLAQGFDATALSAVQAEDTQGLCGEKGEIVTAQSLVDALTDKVMNTIMAKIGTAALTGGMTDLSSGVNSLYSNLNNIGTVVTATGVYTTASWTTGTNTAVLTLPSAGNYIVVMGYELKNPTAETRSMYVQTQIRASRSILPFNRNGWVGWYFGDQTAGYDSRIKYENTTFVINAQSGDKIYPYIHTSVAGAEFNVDICAMII